MKSLNPSSENCRRNGVIGLGLIPGHGPATIKIKVSHRHNQYEVAVPPNSSFGYLKTIISQNIGLKPETCKLLFGGTEKEDNEDIQSAGVMDNSEVLLVDVTACEEKTPEEVNETIVVSKGEADVAEVRKEVDKLAQQVSTLQAVVENGNKVDNKEIICLTEMLMRQLLKLDGIEAEGDGKIQRKMEVRRVQSIVETLDALKSRNSNSNSSTHEDVSVATEWRASDPGCQSVNPSSAPSPSPSPVPHFTPSTFPVYHNPSPMPYHNPSPMTHHNPSPMPYHNPSSVPYHNPSPMPYHNASPMPYYDPSSVPYHNPSPMPYYIPSSVQYYNPSSVPYYDPSTMAYFTPPTQPSSTDSSVPYYVPSHVPASNPFSMPSSSKVTENWEHFG